MDFKTYIWKLFIDSFWNPNNPVFSCVTWITFLYSLFIWGLPHMKKTTEKFPASWINKHRFLILVILLFVSVIIAAHTIQDKTQNENSQLKQTISEQTKQASFHFEFNDFSLTTTPNLNQLFLGVDFYSTQPMIVDDLELYVNGQNIKPNDWQSFKLIGIHTHNYIFDLSRVESACDSTHQDAKFIATIDGNTHESEVFNIYKLTGLVP